MLTTKEQEYGNNLVTFYSSPTNKDQKKIDAFVYADDKGKIIIIKEYLDDIVNPFNISELATYQEKVDKLSSEVLSITDYTKEIETIK